MKRFQGCFAVAQDGFKGLRRYGRRPGRRVTKTWAESGAVSLEGFCVTFPTVLCCDVTKISGHVFDSWFQVRSREALSLQHQA